MKRKIISIILIGMLVFAIFNFFRDSFGTSEWNYEIANKNVQAKDERIGLNVGDKAPGFELQSTTGDFIRLSDYKGKKVMLNFWATWCPPCRAEMPDMEKFYQDSDIEILAINLVETESRFQNIQAFLEENQLTFPILLDNGNQASDLYRIRPIPTTYLIDSHGVIQYHTYGPMDYEMMMNEYEKLN
ncbi:redoxin domain-containing protein [Gracilibacillus xinjiangensis]|uniref:Redoxin domain-containing protein n=1 Tax=Gracilibacillus xinjiangensis TaxID=1193282 RepID=A0ABV8WUN3_9BACI